MLRWLGYPRIVGNRSFGKVSDKVCYDLAPRTRTHLSAATRRQISNFKVIDHVVPCSYMRHYPGGVEPGRERDLKLAVKQYVPVEKQESSDDADAVTLICAHANGFPKELYEPVWDRIYEELKLKGKTIRSLWIADIATQGQSGILNESILGNDPSWYDHARDLLFLTNQKQEDMPQPLIGVAHSMGASQLAALSLLHPRLLQALVLIDPVIQMPNPSMSFAPPSTYRRDLWPSREEAAASFRKSKYYQKWDSRVLDLWIEHGLRDVPTEVYVDTENGEDGKTPVTLTTTKMHEVSHYLRPLYKSDPWTDRDMYPDFEPAVLQDNEYFYRAEPRELFRRLPTLYPPVRYIFGATSELNTPELRRQKLEATGSGLGGSGGVAANKVSETVLDCGHLVSFEKPDECASDTADFIDQQLDQYQKRKQRFGQLWHSTCRRQKIEIDEDWKRNIGPPPQRPPKKAPSQPSPGEKPEIS